VNKRNVANFVFDMTLLKLVECSPRLFSVESPLLPFAASHTSLKGLEPPFRLVPSSTSDTKH